MAVGDQGDVCGHEPCGTGAGGLESQWYGVTADHKIGLAGLGDREGAIGAGGVCIQVAFCNALECSCDTQNLHFLKFN